MNRALRGTSGESGLIASVKSAATITHNGLNTVVRNGNIISR